MKSVVSTRCRSFAIAALIFFWWLAPTGAGAQHTIPLYEGPAPGSKPVPDREEWTPNAMVDTVVRYVTRPELGIFLPGTAGTAVEPVSPAGRAAVIICPGGGYGALLISREGNRVAKAFNKAGIAAFVLKYRLPSDEAMEDKSIAPLQDAQRAIQVVRQHAAEWGIDPERIGIMGFSAGGHLAATAGTRFNKALIANPAGISLRPDFMLLINPVISFTDSIGHTGSRDNLLGPAPTAEQIRLNSAEFQIRPETPPAFLVHSSADTVVVPAHSFYFYRKLRSYSIPAALHLYATGEHGFLTAPAFDEWFGRVLYWMQQMQYIAG